MSSFLHFSFIRLPRNILRPHAVMVCVAQLTLAALALRGVGATCIEDNRVHPILKSREEAEDYIYRLNRFTARGVGFQSRPVWSNPAA